MMSEVMPSLFYNIETLLDADIGKIQNKWGNTSVNCQCVGRNGEGERAGGGGRGRLMKGMWGRGDGRIEGLVSISTSSLSLCLSLSISLPAPLLMCQNSNSVNVTCRMLLWFCSWSNALTSDYLCLCSTGWMWRKALKSKSKVSYLHCLRNIIFKMISFLLYPALALEWLMLYWRKKTTTLC